MPASQCNGWKGGPAWRRFNHFVTKDKYFQHPEKEGGGKGGTAPLLSLLLLFFLLPPPTPWIFNSSLVFPSKAFTIHCPFLVPAFHLSIHHSPYPGPFFPLFAIFHAVGFVYKLLYYLKLRGGGCWKESEKAGLRSSNSAPLHFYLTSHKMCKSCSWEFHFGDLPCHCPSCAPSHVKTSLGKAACTSKDTKGHGRERALSSTVAGRHLRWADGQSGGRQQGPNLAGWEE